jgi:tetratricopeptide (TPR) repeat protein
LSAFIFVLILVESIFFVNDGKSHHSSPGLTKIVLFFGQFLYNVSTTEEGLSDFLSKGGNVKKRKILFIIVVLIILSLLVIYLVGRKDGKIGPLLKEGDLNFQQGKLAQAVVKYQEALKISKRSAPAHVSLAKCYAQQGKIEEAIGEYLESIKYDRSNHEAHYLLASLYFNNFKYEEALQEAEKAIQLSPKNKDYRYFTAQMYDRTKRYAQAIKEWETLLQMQPGTSMYLVPLAGAYYRNGDLDKARSLLKEVASAEPDTQFGRIAGSILKDIETKHEKEIKLRDLQRELTFHPDNAEAYYGIAKIYYEDEKLQDAEKAAKKALSLNSQNAEYYILMSKIYDKMNNKAEAVKQLEEAVKAGPKDYKTILSLAGFYFQVGREAEAIQKLKEVISLAPGSEEAKFAEGKLKGMRK